MRKSIARSCFVPGCKSGNRNAPKVSFFKAPREVFRLEKWRKHIPRVDKELDQNCAVCALHFEEHFIERNFCHIVKGEQVVFPRDRPSLKPDAIPTIFPSLPKYLSKKIPKKREANRNCNRQRFDEKSLTNGAPEPKRTKVERVDSFDPDNYELPSKYWSKQLFRNDPDVTVYSVSDFDETTYSVVPEKMVVVKQNNSEGTPNVDIFIRGAKRESAECSSAEELHQILSKTDNLVICSGAGTKIDFPHARIGRCGNIIVYGDRFFSANCDNRVVKGNIKMCQYCKSVRHILLNQRSQLKLKALKMSH